MKISDAVAAEMAIVHRKNHPKDVYPPQTQVAEQGQERGQDQAEGYGVEHEQDRALETIEEVRHRKKPLILQQPHKLHRPADRIGQIHAQTDRTRQWDEDEQDEDEQRRRQIEQSLKDFPDFSALRA